MDNEELLFEEHPLLPEHYIPPEFTPEYPDVSFFKESYVTAREENIFQGHPPEGEGRTRANRKEKQKEKTRFNWLRQLLGSALRGGAAVFGVCTLIVTIVSGADIPKSSTWQPVKVLLQELKGDPIVPPHDYTPEQLAALWEGDPDGPHKYDYDHISVQKTASCQEDGLIELTCSECGMTISVTVHVDHVPAATVKEN